MKPLILALFCAFTASLHAIETKMLLVAVAGVNNEETPHYSETLAIAEGDRAELVGGLLNDANSGLEITFNGILVYQPLFLTATFQGGGQEKNLSKIVVPGPATIRFKAQHTSYATLDIQRAGAPSNPVAVPQEAGSNFNVILEQSSDLVNWTPANPGTYPGTEVKRFFRTRIVKLP